MLQTEPRRGAAEGRECTACPPWVVACAHWEGLITWITDCGVADSQLKNHGCSTCSDFLVYGPIERNIKCRCGDDHYVCLKLGDHYPDLPAAEAEFRAREAALLGRDE